VHQPIISQRISSHRPKRSTAIAIFARLPVSGEAKTRLIPLLGRAGAAEFQAALIEDASRKVAALISRSGRVAPYWFLAGTPSVGCFPMPHSGAQWTTLTQHGSGLGVRLDHAFRALLRRHAAAAVIGTDSPLLAPRTLRVARRELVVCDAVLGPCPDGGYYLVGLRDRACATLGRRGVFARVRWGTAFAFRDTLRNLLERGLSCSILEPVDDVDRPRDLRALRRELARSTSARRLAPATSRFVKARLGLSSGGREGAPLRRNHTRIASNVTWSAASQPA
jgi:uncharacterized protein